MTATERKPKAIGVDEVTDFAIWSHPELAKWTREMLRDWLGYHMQEGFVLLVSGDGSNIAGMIVVRPMMNPSDALDGYSFDYEGPCLYIAAVIADCGRTMRALAVSVHQRFGVRAKIAWHNHRTGNLIVHSSFAVARRVLKGS